jgi:hypothetical protein
MNVICLVIAVILFVLVGFKVNPEALSSIDLQGFGLAFFAASFFPFGSIVINRP